MHLGIPRPLEHHPHNMTHAAASGLAALGRGNDKMLVHMTPQEVGGLQHLAMAAGGSLSINPNTGLPEAGFLSHLLPMIAGFALAPFTGGLSAEWGISNGLLDAGIVGAGDAAVTGSVKNGLMAGLGAYGGASLASGLSAAGTANLQAPVSASTIDPNTVIQATPGTSSTFDYINGVPAQDTPDTLGSSGTAYGAKGAADANAAISAANKAAMSTAYNAPVSGSDMLQGFKNITSNPTSGMGMTTLKAVGSAMGPAGIAGIAVPVIQTAQDAMQKTIPAASTSSPEYYNTTYDPRTQRYSVGNWSTQFAGPGFTGAPGSGQTANSQGPMGSYADPYTGIMALNQNTVGIASGGNVKRLASGGDSSSDSTSALKDYYSNLMSGSATTSSLPKTDPSANNAYMASISSGTAPTQPLGSTSTTPWINSGYQAEVAANAAAANSGNSSGTTTSTSSYNPNISDISCGGAAVPTYSWNPATQSYSQTGVSGGTGSGAYGWDPATQSYIAPVNVSGGMGGQGGGNKMAAGGGIAALAHGGSPGLGSYSDGGRLLRGPGDGMSDDIPAHIVGHKPQPAALADGEFVIPADVVSHLGNGSTDAGSKKLYQMMENVRKARTGNPNQGKRINPTKFLPA